MATKQELIREIEGMAHRAKAGTLTARERRRFRKLACRAGLAKEHRILAPKHSPALENAHKYTIPGPQGGRVPAYDRQTVERSVRASRWPKGRRNRL